MLQDTPSFLAYWRNARPRRVRVLDALEFEDLEWAPATGAFSFGDLFRHRLGLGRSIPGRMGAPSPPSR